MRDAVTRHGRRHALIVCLNGDWAGTLRLPALLHRAGAHVSALAPAGALLRSSQHVDRWLPSTLSDGSSLLADLRDATSTDRYDWIVLGDDPTLSLMLAAAENAPAAQQEWFNRVLPVPSDRRSFLARKSALAAAADRFGIAIPRSFICHSFEQVASAAAAIGFPVIVKADESYAGNGVRPAADAAQLREAYAALAGRLPVVVQPYLGGRVGSTNVLFDHGKPLICVPLYKHLCFPLPFGPSCARLIRDLDEPMLQMARGIGAASGFHGIGGIDWIEPPGQPPLVLEFNARPVSSLQVGTRMNMDVIGALRGMLAGDDVPSPLAAAAPAQRLVYLFPQYPRRCLIYHEWRGLAKLLLVHKVDWPWGEPLILIRQLAQLCAIARKQVYGSLRCLPRKIAHALRRRIHSPATASPTPPSTAVLLADVKAS